MKNIRSSAYQAFLRRLREARLAAGKTQAQVAKALGQPQSFVSKVEGGERRLDPLELKSLSDLYGRDIRWFFGESQPPRSGSPRRVRAAKSART
jgi:transcriptional regulator with XRE-family HTH domain